MWRSSFPSLKQGVASTVCRFNPELFGSIRTGFVESNCGLRGYLFTNSAGCGGDGGDHAEVSKVMRLVDVEALKMKLGAGGNEVIQYSMLLKTCESMGIAKSAEEAKKLAKVFDDAGVVFIFRDKVHLHPHKVMDMIRRAIPLALMPEDDPRKEELKKLQAKQEEIDLQAHKQVQHILWAGLGLSLAQASLFFRLTFWEFSWDVMEPITFFTTSSGLILGYAYFLFTSRDPTYQDLMKRLFLSRRRKLMKKHNFDVERFMELKKKCISPSDCRGGTRNSGSLA